MKFWNNVDVLSDEAGHVTKYVFTNDDAVAETVLYRYPDYKTRTVICCSTQSGCPVGCRFCGAGDGFVRSLTSFEIVEQVTEALTATDITPRAIEKLQIMFMSMGEPMLNLDGLINAIVLLNNRYPRADLLISTSGPKADYECINRISQQIPTVGLQFSIHETTDVARDKLIPFKGKLDLRGIAKQGRLWYNATGRKPFFNYCAHDGNSSKEDAVRLANLFPASIWNATVSVISERDSGMPSTNDHQRGLARDFASLLLGLSYDVRTFDPSGQDTIGGGCGQLHYVQDWMKDNPDKVKKSIGRDLPVIHTPQEVIYV